MNILLLAICLVVGLATAYGFSALIHHPEAVLNVREALVVGDDVGGGGLAISLVCVIIARIGPR